MKRVSIPALLALGLLFACASPAAAAEPKKNGAGLIFITPEGSVLLLLRSGRHNAGKWALPGGNVEESDADWLAAAKREAAEELGGAAGLPAYKIVGDGILTKRGRSGQKHFTLFVARVTAAARAAYVPPNLDKKEHSQWKWFTLSEIDDLIAEGNAHPVVKKVFGRHRATVLADAGVMAPVAPGAGAAAAKRGAAAAAVGSPAAAPGGAAATAGGARRL